MPIVPTGPQSAPKLLPPIKCYLDQNTEPVLYEKLFVFVNFGTKANRFLAACGLKRKVLIQDVAEVLIGCPERFFELAGLWEAMYAAGRKKDAVESLLEIVNAFNEDVYASEPIAKWVSGELVPHPFVCRTLTASLQTLPSGISHLPKATAAQRRSQPKILTRRRPMLHPHRF